MSQEQPELVTPDVADDGMGEVRLPVSELLVPHKNRAALTAYYLAIFSLIPGIGLLVGPFAFVLGIQGLCQATVEPGVRGAYHAMFSIALSLITTVVNWAALVAVGMGWFLITAIAPA